MTIEEVKNLPDSTSVIKFDEKTRPSDLQLTQTAQLYAEVSGGPPWFEVNSCTDCGQYFGPESNVTNPCTNCGGVLSAVYPEEKVKEQISDLLEKPNAALYLVVSDKKIRGFALLGFTRDVSELISTKFGDEDKEEFAQAVQQSLPADTVFYINEVGLDNQLRGKGMGKMLMTKLLGEASLLNLPVALSTRVDTVLTPICLRLDFRQIFGLEAVLDKNGNVTLTENVLVTKIDNDAKRTFFVRGNTYDKGN